MLKKGGEGSTAATRNNVELRRNAVESDPLNVRFNLLRTQLEQFLRQITEKEHERDDCRLVNISQQWLAKMQQSKVFGTIQQQKTWLNTSIQKCSDVLESLHTKVRAQATSSQQEKFKSQEKLFQTIDEVESMFNELHIKLTRLTEVEMRFDEFLADVEKAMYRMKIFQDDLTNKDTSSDIQVYSFCLS